MVEDRRRAQPGLGPAALTDQTGEYSTGGIGEYLPGGHMADRPEDDFSLHVRRIGLA